MCAASNQNDPSSTEIVFLCVCRTGCLNAWVKLWFCLVLLAWLARIEPESCCSSWPKKRVWCYWAILGEQEKMDGFFWRDLRFSAQLANWKFLLLGWVCEAQGVCARVEGRDHCNCPPGAIAGTSVEGFHLSQLSSKSAPFSVVDGKEYALCLAVDSIIEKCYRRISLICAWLIHPKSRG